MIKLIAIFLTFLMATKAYSNESLTPSKSGKFDVGQLSLYLECYGNGSPSIIVHSGFGGAGSDGGWKAVIDEVGGSNRICLYDRANLGKSDKFQQSYDLAVVAEHLHELLKVSEVETPYLMVGHSYGSYPIKVFNHRYSSDVLGVLLVDPTQYGMFYNGIAKWNPEEDRYDGPTLERMNAELKGWNNPDQNPEKVNLRRSAKILQESKDFGSKPFVLLWSKNGIWQGGDAPDDWHPDVWERMKEMYASAIDSMHNLSTNKRIIFANTNQHNIFYYEPESVIREIRYLLQETDTDE